MKIFLPFAIKELHPYLEEIRKHSQFEFVQEDYKNFDPSFKIVHIHWPESIFNWQEPTSKDLKSLEKEIKIWRKHAKIIYTKHDYKRTKGSTINFELLFKLVEENTDVFIHLGEYSRKLYQRKYPEAKHEIINHHLFETSFPQLSKNEARIELGIDEESLVIIAPGNIRTSKERKLVMNAFKSIQSPNKVLISTNMKAPVVDFKGRVSLKKLFDIQGFIQDRFKKKYRSPQHLFTYAPVSRKDLSIKMSAADIVLVPRIDLLNSGILYLGLTFRKITIGPAIGNIEEQLKLQELPTFNPKSASSVSKALKEGIEMFKMNSFTLKKIEKHTPAAVAKELDLIFIKSGKNA